MIKAYIKIILATIFWSSSLIFSKIALEDLNPISLIFFRLLISSVLLLIVFKINGQLKPLKKKYLKLFILMIIFEPFLYFLCENYSIRYCSSTIVALIISLVPLLIPIAAYLFLNTQLKLANLIGLIVSFIGIFIMVFNSGKIDYSWIGLFLCFGAVICAVFYGIICTKLSENNDSSTIVFYQSIIGIIFFIPLLLIFETTNLQTVQISAKLVLSIITLCVTSSILAFLFYIDTIKVLGINKTSAFINLMPVFTAILSYLIFNEHFSVEKIIGIIIVIVGLFLSQLNNK